MWTWMAPCSHRLHLLLLLLLLPPCCRRARFGAAAAAAKEAALSHYSFPVFDGKSTADGVAVATNSAMLAPATFLFDAQIFPQFNQSEGYVLLSRPVALWRVDDDAAVREEASFNTSFTVVDSGRVSEPVAFVVLLDSFPPLNRKNEKHGQGATTGVDADSGVSGLNATSGLAAVEVGTVSSYGPRHRGVGLNVTITPNRTSSAGQLAVRIEYDAAAHRLSVYAGDTPDPLVLDAPLDLASRLPTRAALAGFFADTVRDVVVGVRDWELTVDRLHDNDDEARREEAAKQSSSVSLVVILVAAIGSVAAVAVVVVASVMVCFVVSRRRALDEELQQCYSAYHARTRL